MSDVHEQLLRGLQPGAVMWLRASGQSLWPLLRDGDSLRVERVEGTSLRLGEIAVVKLPNGVLAAHLVASLDPLQTASSVGVLDPQPVEALGRVVGFRRDREVHELPASGRLLLRFLPATSRALKRLPLLRQLVRVLRRL
ncbi:MAG: hypothetical protein Q8N23_01955 [Archangium sp.]|nr:hypothetical protein [Archangium sp.]MDP3151404.1 hypothetical protein [Archangium sp.]MDP3575296.1 hypothetical protein [Archangium sp.]